MCDPEQNGWHELVNIAIEDVVVRLKRSPNDERLQAELRALTDIAANLLQGKPPTRVEQFVLTGFIPRAA